jgi:hypothetical protein
MKKHFINALAAVGILATLNSCSKEEQVEKTATTASQESLAPSAATGAHISLYTTVNKEYLKTTPMKLDKYRSMVEVDSVCNQELSIGFYSSIYRSHGRVVKDTTNWGNKPYVTDESPTLIAHDRFQRNELIIRLSKKVTEFGFEYNSRYFGIEYPVIQTIWDKKTQTKIGTGHVLRLNQKLPNNSARFGTPKGAALLGIKSDVPFDEIRVTLERTKEIPLPIRMPHFTTGMRYKLAK